MKIGFKTQESIIQDQSFVIPAIDLILSFSLFCFIFIYLFK